MLYFPFPERTPSRPAGLELAVKPAFDIFDGVASFFLQLAEPFLLLAVRIMQVAVGELAPFLLGFAFDLIPGAARFELGRIADAIFVEVHEIRGRG